MGGISVPEKSSLDRLKALDGLPNLPAQLQEAKLLCNHSARAEMILRWLCGKLKASDEARKESSCWKLLSACLRLISTSRIAPLLGSNGFIEALQATCANEDVLEEETFVAVYGALELLFTYSEPNSGAAIKSSLTLNNTVAASICGNWFRHAYEIRRQKDLQRIESHRSLLQPALRIWALRKRGDADDELFNSECLVPVSLFLVLLHSGSKPTSNKRKRMASASTCSEKDAATLESLVAKHTVLPARVAFFKEREPQVRKGRGNRSASSQVGIKERLGPLKVAIRNQSNEQTIQAIPRILDIALRSVSTPTPKHRMSERPWIEALITALRSCCMTQDQEVKNRSLAAILDVIHVHGHSLSIQALTSMVNEDAFADQESKQPVDWQLVAKIIELDANVFSNRTLMKTLFEALNQRQVGDTLDDDTRTLLKERIIIPIMKAHAKARILNTFIDCWTEQLLQPENLSTLSLWSQLQTAFASIVEEALTSEQVLLLFDRLAASVNETATSQPALGELETHCKLNANLTVLAALLSGVTNDMTTSKLQERLGNLLDNLYTLADKKEAKLAATVPCPLWELLTRAFELWFPSWAIQQSSKATIVEGALTPSLRKAFDVASTQCTANGDSKSSACIAQSAQMFLATLCTYFQRYEDFDQSQSLCSSAIEVLGRQQDAALSVLLKFPNLLRGLSSATQKDLVATMLVSASESGIEETKEQMSPLASLKALVAAACGTDQGTLLASVVAAALDQLKEYCVGMYTANLELVPVSVLCSIPPASLDQGQRVAILDAILRLPATKGLPLYADSRRQLRHRLASMLTLLRLPCRGAQLLADTKGIWQIIDWFHEGVPIPTNSLMSTENIDMLREVINATINSWLATQTSQVSREALFGLSKRMREQIENINNQSAALSMRLASLGLFQTVLTALASGYKGDAKLPLVHQESQVTDLYVTKLASELEVLVSNLLEAGDSNILPLGARMFVSLLEAVASLPEHTWSIAKRNNETRSDLETVVEQSAQSLLKSEAKGTSANLQHRLEVQVAAFRLLCKYSRQCGQMLAEYAKNLLQKQLAPTEHSTVLTCFENAWKSNESEWALGFSSLMFQDSPRPPTTLLLSQRILKRLTRDDFEEDKETGQNILKGTGDRGDALPTHEIFDQVLKEVSENPNLQARRIALQSLAIIFKEKAFLVNQYGIEQTLSTLHNILESYAQASALYTDICSVLATLLTAHRSSLSDRFHLLVPLFQSLLTTIFINSSPSASGQARQLPRLLETLTNPPQIRHHKKTKTSDLVDETRKAQIKAGQYAQYILHHYCALILSRTPQEGVVEGLKQGVWSLIEAIEQSNKEGVKVLSSAMNNSERAVLRGVYEDWKRFGKWEGL